MAINYGFSNNNNGRRGGRMSMFDILDGMSNNRNERQYFQNNREDEDNPKVGEFFTDALAQTATGDPNVRSYWTHDDYAELYNEIKPQLKMALGMGKISKGQYKEMWKEAVRIFWSRRKLGTVKTTTIKEEIANKYGAF